MPLGTVLLRQVRPEPLKLAIGVILVSYVAWNYFVRHPPRVVWGGRIADAVAGFIGGVMGGMASVSGPVPVTWVQLRNWSRDEQRGVNQPYNMAILFLALVSAAAAGLLDARWLLWAAMSLPVSMIGTRYGLRLYGRFNDEQFRRIVLGVLALSGAALILSAL